MKRKEFLRKEFFFINIACTMQKNVLFLVIIEERGQKEEEEE